MKPVIIWAPRILATCFALFLCLFALDAFSGEQGFFRSLLGFMIHLGPAFLVMLALRLSWSRGWLGFLFFGGLGALYIGMAWGRFSPVTYFIISGPLFIIAILFLAQWYVLKVSSEK